LQYYIFGVLNYFRPPFSGSGAFGTAHRKNLDQKRLRSLPVVAHAVDDLLTNRLLDNLQPPFSASG